MSKVKSGETKDEPQVQTVKSVHSRSVKRAKQKGQKFSEIKTKATLKQIQNFPQTFPFLAKANSQLELQPQVLNSFKK